MRMASLSAEEVRDLDISCLVRRMDDVRETGAIERYGREQFEITQGIRKYPRVADIVDTHFAEAFDERGKKRLADAAFRFLMQLDLIEVALGISNSVVYGPNYNEDIWVSPEHWMKVAVLGQYEIVASRIALECFFDLLHIAHKGQRINSTSKFKAFRKWVMEEGNPYKYFVGHIVQAFEFDRTHRQKEVHGTSRFAHSLLKLERPEESERNTPHGLTNLLLNVWEPLLQIMNGIRPSSIAVFVSCDEFANEYFRGREDPESFDDFLKDVIEEKMK